MEEKPKKKRGSQTKAARKRLSESVKRGWLNPSRRKKRIRGMREAWKRRRAEGKAFHWRRVEAEVKARLEQILAKQ